VGDGYWGGEDSRKKKITQAGVAHTIEGKWERGNEGVGERARVLRSARGKTQKTNGLHAFKYDWQDSP